MAWAPQSKAVREGTRRLHLDQPWRAGWETKKSVRITSLRADIAGWVTFNYIY